MKKFQFIGLMLLLLSACSPQATPLPVPTFTPSPMAQVMTSTAMPSATVGTPAALSTVITGTPEACKDEAAIVLWTRDDVPYDYTETTNNKPVPPNGHFSMSWTLQNSGTCIWNSSYKMAFKSGVFFTQAQSYPVVPDGQTVAPGQNAIINISMVAPSKTGGYQAVWQLQNSKGKTLISFNIIIRVDRGSAKPPLHPIQPSFTYSCTAGVAKIHLAWIDAANNEDGYRIYRGGLPLLDLPANTSAYTDVVPGKGTYEYTVVAFNVAGEAPVNISVEVKACQ